METSRVLIVEDDPILLKAISEKLKLAGLETFSFYTGESALEYLFETKVTPNVIWLDYHLPGMTGTDFIKRVKANSKLKGIPVVVISNSAEEKAVSGAIAAGAEAYLLKAEHRLEELVQNIKMIADRR